MPGSVGLFHYVYVIIPSAYWWPSHFLSSSCLEIEICVKRQLLLTNWSRLGKEDMLLSRALKYSSTEGVK